MLIAGHAVRIVSRLPPALLITRQTTGALLFFALALLAIHQDEQAALHDEIREVLAEGESPVSDFLRA